MHARHSLAVIGFISSFSYLAITGLQTGTFSVDSWPLTAGVNAALEAAPLAEEPEWDVDAEVAAVEPAALPQASAIEQQLFDLVNQDRVANGLSPVGFAPELLDIARERAAAQDPGTSLNHYDASGKIAFVGLFQSAGVRYQRAGENLARISGSDATRAPRAEVALMNSPTHRANILEGSYQYMAVGATRDASGNSVFAQIFWNP